MATVEGSHIGTSGGSSVGALLYYGTISSSATEYTVPIKAGGKLTAKNWTSASIVYKMGGSPNTTGTAYWTKTDDSTHSSGSSWYTLSQQTVHFNRTHSDYTATIYASITTNGNTSTAKKTFTVSKRASYTVSYNANGGSGAPSAQTKWYGEDLTLSATVPTRAKYKFKGWATSATGDVAVQPSGTYTGNAAITYYAVWELVGDVKMGSYSALRCDSSGNADDEGTWGKFTCTYILSGQGLNEGSVTARYRASDVSTWTNISNTDISHSNHSKPANTPSLSVNVSCLIKSNISQDKSYIVELTVTDSYGNTATASDYISQAYFTMDFLAGGKGIGIGTTASCDEGKHPNGLLTCAMDADFKGTVNINEIKLALDTALSIANGGTGATTAAAACSNLGIKDYIVTQGTSGAWTYEKYNSGLVKLWCTSSTTQKMDTAIGNVYRTANNVKVTFPFTVTDPKVQLTSISGVLNGAYVSHMESNYFNWYPIRFTKDTASKARLVSIYVVGRWK